MRNSAVESRVPRAAYRVAVYIRVNGAGGPSCRSRSRDAAAARRAMERRHHHGRSRRGRDRDRRVVVPSAVAPALAGEDAELPAAWKPHRSRAPRSSGDGGTSRPRQVAGSRGAIELTPGRPAGTVEARPDRLLRSRRTRRTSEMGGFGQGSLKTPVRVPFYEVAPRVNVSSPSLVLSGARRWKLAAATSGASFYPRSDERRPVGRRRTGGIGWGGRQLSVGAHCGTRAARVSRSVRPAPARVHWPRPATPTASADAGRRVNAPVAP